MNYRDLFSSLDKGSTVGKGENLGSNSESSRKVFSFSLWDFALGMLPFEGVIREELKCHDGEDVDPVGEGYMLRGMSPLVMLDDFCVVDAKQREMPVDEIRNNQGLGIKMMIAQRKHLAPIPYIFSTPAVLFSPGLLSLAFVCMSKEVDWAFSLKSEKVIPRPAVCQSIMDMMNAERKVFSCGTLDNDSDTQVYLLTIDQIERYVYAALSQQRKNRMCYIDRKGAEKYFGLLQNGFSDQDELDKLAREYEQMCGYILSLLETDKRLLEIETEE